jgi:hypothetical protein
MFSHPKGSAKKASSTPLQWSTILQLVPFVNNESTAFGNHLVSFPNAFNQQKPGTE